MNNVLLVKPKYNFDSNHPVQFTNAEKALPLGLSYIAAVLEKKGWKVKVLDYQVDNERIEDVLASFRPDVVGVTAFSKEFEHGKELMAAVKKWNKKTPVMLGGPHSNAYGEKIFEFTDDVDIVALRESEETVSELADALENGNSLSTIAGIIYKGDGGEAVKNPERSFIKNLDDVPFMALDHFKVKEYYSVAGTFRHLPSVTMITSRGCPHPCTFCNTDLFGRSVRLRSAENVLDEIGMVVEKFGAREINFCDETFTINNKRVVAICEGLLKRNYKITWKCSTRVDSVNKELLQLMKRSGCFFVAYGVESGSQRILDKIAKGITLEQIREAFYQTRKAGMLSMAYFMMNTPGETIEDIEASIRFSREIAPSFLNFELIKPYYGTQIRGEIEGDPDIKINRELWSDWSEYSTGNRLFYEQKGVPEEYLQKAYLRATRDYYINPIHIFKTALQIRTLPQLKSYVRAGWQVAKMKMVTSQN